MKIANSLKNIFYTFEIIQAKNNQPYIYWTFYAIAIIQHFCNLNVDGNLIFFNQKQNPLSVSVFLNDQINFGYLITSALLQIIVVISLFVLKTKNQINKSNQVEILLKTAFIISLINFTISFDFVNHLQLKNYKVNGILFLTLANFINLGIMNFTFNSKRIWPINQMLILDCFRIVTLWVNGSKVLLLLCLFVYLIISIAVIYFRPIFYNSKQNRITQMIISSSLAFSIVSFIQILCKNEDKYDLRIVIFLSLIITLVIYFLCQKWLNYCISHLMKGKNKNQKNQLNLNQIILLQFMEQNLKYYKDQIMLFTLHHSVQCNNPACICKSIVEKIFKRNQQNDEKTQNFKNPEFKNKKQKTNQNDIKIMKKLFTQLILDLISQFQHNQFNLRQASPQKGLKKEEKRKIKIQQKQISIARKRQIHKDTQILKYFEIQKLINSFQNLNLAYFTLKQLQLELKEFKAFSYHDMGVFQHLREQIVYKKLIILQRPSVSVNKFCINFYNSQKISNRLQENILKSVCSIKDFWTEIQVQEPDTSKFTHFLAKFSHYHDRVMDIYAKLEKEQQKQTLQIKMLFKFYQKVLDLDGSSHFFKDIPLSQQKAENLKNAASLNLKLYSDEASTQIMSCSINQDNFGQIKYKSSKTKSLIDSQYKNISDFLPSSYVSIHKSQIKKSLFKDQNYYQHTTQKPCYILFKEKIIRPIYLQTHLMAFLTINQIELVSFMKPIIYDEKLLNTGTYKNFNNVIQEEMVAVFNTKTQIVSCTATFQLEKNRMFEDIEMQAVLNEEIFKGLQTSNPYKLELSDSDYQITLVKKIYLKASKQGEQDQILYFILFENCMQKTIFKNETIHKIQQHSTRQNQCMKSTKNKKKLNLKNLVMQSLDNQLDGQVNKFDQKVQKINKIFDMATKPHKYSCRSYQTKISILFIVTFLIFIILITVFLYQRKAQFSIFNKFLRDFSSLQVAATQSLTYLRQININSWNGVEINFISTIVQEVERLNQIIFVSLQQLSQYFNEIWTCIDVLEYGPRIIRKEKTYVVVNNYVISSITNIVQSLKQNINGLNFTPIQSMIKIPYSQVQQSFLKLVSNGVSFVIPNSILLRQKTLNNVFLPKLNYIVNQPIFFIPIIGFLISLSIIIYGFFLRKRLSNLASSSTSMFKTLNIRFASDKIKAISKYSHSLIQKQIHNDNLKQSKRIAWKSISNMFQKTTAFAFGTFVDNTANMNQNQMIPTISIRMQNQQTDRQLVNDSMIQSSVGQDNKKGDIQNTSQQNNNQEAHSAFKTNKSQIQYRRLQFDIASIFRQSIFQKIKYSFIVLPLIVYFGHIFIFTIQFNNFMSKTLSLQNQLYYRRQALTYSWNTQYELGLFQSFFPIADYTLKGFDSTYKSAKSLEILEQQVSKYLFGRLNNYNQANKLLMYGNICQNLQLFHKSQPFFGINITKEGCQTVNEGVLQSGLKAAVVQVLQSLRSLVLQNQIPQFLLPQQRFTYLNDSRITKMNNLYPYLLLAAEHLNIEFDKDFNFFIKAYELFLLIDTPLMVIFSIALFYLYFSSNGKKIKRELSFIKSTFLLIGHKRFLSDSSILQDQTSQDQGSRYFILQ